MLGSDSFESAQGLGRQEEEDQSAGAEGLVRQDLKELMSRYLHDRMRYGSPLPWYSKIPRIPADLCPYRLVEVELELVCQDPATHSLSAVLIAPWVGREFNPNHAEKWFAKRVAGQPQRITYTELFLKPVIPLP